MQSSAEMLAQSSKDIFTIHPLSAGLLCSLPYLGTMLYGLWSKNLHYPMHLFLHPYFHLNYLLTSLGLDFCLAVNLYCLHQSITGLDWWVVAPCHYWKSKEGSGFPHLKLVCNFLWGRTHIPLMRNVHPWNKAMDMLEAHPDDKNIHPSEMNVCSCFSL